MAKSGIKNAMLSVNNGSIIVYYHRETTMRFPTGVTISKNKKNGKWVDWDEKREAVKSHVQEADAANQIILDAKNRVNDIIRENALNNIVLTGKELTELITQSQSEKKLVRSAKLLDMYKQFHEEKRQDLAVRGNPISLKDYTSFLNVIIDYQAANNTTIKIVDVNANFCRLLQNWLMTKSPQSVATKDGTHQLKTKGNLKPKTLKKRFDTFKEFFRFLQANKFIDGYDFLKDFAKSKIPNISTQKVTLSVEEVFKLRDYKFEDVRLDKIRQLFTFACFTGLRWNDLVGFDSEFITDINGTPVYKKVAKKTAKSSGAVVSIPLCSDAISILKDNGMSLKPLLTSNPQANSYLKEALKQTGLFDQITNITDKDTGEYLRRYEAISMHKGRDTFITNLVNVTPLNELMKYTGHTKLSTLQRYIDQTRQINPTYVNTTFKRTVNG